MSADEARAREIAEGADVHLRLLVLEFASRRMSRNYRPSSELLDSAERSEILEWFERRDPYDGNIERRRRLTPLGLAVAEILKEQA